VVKSLWIDSGGNWDMGTAKKQSSKIAFDTAGAFADGTPVQYNGEVALEDNGNTQIIAGATIVRSMKRIPRYIQTRQQISPGRQRAPVYARTFKV
jgi:hypothetical protein